MLKKKYRKIGLVLWCDNPIHIKAIDYIKKNYPHYIYILHDKDTKEDNTLKKAHWHVILYFPNQKLISTLKSQLGVNDSDFYEIRSLSGQLRYLIHFDDEDKFQYSKDDLQCDKYMYSKFLFAIKDVSSEVDDATVLFEYIDTYAPTLVDLFQFVADNDLYSTYRRNYTMFKDLCLLNCKQKSSKRKEVNNG